MRNPEYTFTLLARRNGADVASIQAHPIYAAGLSKEISKESGEQFFRARLNGQLTFNGADYAFIVSQSFVTEIRLQIWCNMQAGVYWTGRFFKTDCEFDEDARTVVVTPSALDEYTPILEGIEREYDLAKLAPQIEQIAYDRRPALQIYVAGQSAIGCYLSGMWWESACEAVTSDSALRNTYHFQRMAGKRVVEISGNISPSAAIGYYTGDTPGAIGNNYTYTSGRYRFKYTAVIIGQGVTQTWAITTLTNVVLWRYEYTSQNPINPSHITLQPVGIGVTGTAVADITDTVVYGRLICNVAEIDGNNTYAIPSNDFVEDNKNYKRCYPSYGSGTESSAIVYFNTELSDEPTEWGRNADGKYYTRPERGRIWNPVARSAWDYFSVWYSVGEGFDETPEGQASDRILLRDSYPISSVISVLLKEFAPGITHEATTEYSQFLYGVNPITEGTERVFITPKSNIVNSQYDQPAQKAPITLRDVLNMLRDCFQCYWWLDGGKLRIEHIAYFKGGGQYFGTPVVGIDLTAERVPRSGKSWAFGRARYEYDKPDSEGRYEFGWMDDVSEPFEGSPIDIISPYVEQSQIETISVSQFTSDVDYILLMPGEVSKDGFVLLVAEDDGDGYALPYLDIDFEGVPSRLQNGKAAFAYLQRFYAYDMPAPDCEVAGEPFTVYGVKQLKRQSITFPYWTDPDLLRLIKTEIGNGKIQSLSVNLCSRLCTATLSYDTE